jgi:hypothetical protein
MGRTRLTRRGRLVLWGTYLGLTLAGMSILNNTPPLPTAQAIERPLEIAPRPAKVIPWTVARSQSYARLASLDYDWGSDQYACLKALWTKESNWRHRAFNRTPVYQYRDGKRVRLHAGGIPQILGLDPKMHPMEQIDRGLAYIDSRFASPCGAWRFWQKKGWY